jgi:hypothetical protein
MFNVFWDCLFYDNSRIVVFWLLVFSFINKKRNTNNFNTSLFIVVILRFEIIYIL